MTLRNPRRTALRIALMILALPVPAVAVASGDPQPGAFQTGGAGSEEREALAMVAADYNVRLTFAEAKSGAYIADVGVEIDALDGGELHRSYAGCGPLFYVRLDPGRYRLRLLRQGQADQAVELTVKATATVQRVFYWAAS